MMNLPLRLGLTMWSHAGWQSTFYGAGTPAAQRLEKYARVFHTVEGNTTFYASPSMNTVQNWRAATHDDFRFTFKLPKAITHEHKLTGCQDQLQDFMMLMEPLHSRVGLWTIQLPATFGPQHLEQLKKFCAYFPAGFPLSVEVRHLEFFAKGEAEKALNQWLVESSIDRIIMDSRPIFSAKPTTDVIIDAQKKKPKVPVHAIATAQTPMIRFIGHPELEANYPFFEAWMTKLPHWIEQGKQPYLMVHTPDNIEAPLLAAELYQQLQQRLTLPTLTTFPAQDDQHQITLF
ncbi:DUF72 domain-containing protein [Vibrio anguillarum]|uniref:DUF72 domain-containing protein n=1 Tax=Vibrio anguillarum TaxID=55601 RepID=UPI001694BBF3|nr:DUF72 domain-containing protein [Vibrio anguillarum]MCC4236199.1 DUF72 domain-containing protein [Vibrio anguillarum]MDT3846776.1 DUF72 domain-containing protein [Vibrio anguillarum]NOI04277.1 DUF72 domain-containing protein [Vibrio anguillarum]